MADPALEEACESVADGADVNWGALESAAAASDSADFVKQLRVVAEVASVHRRDPEETRLADSSVLAALPPDSLPRQWGHYELLENLGSGTFGTVYRARDLELQRHIAIKLLHVRDGDTGRMRERVRHEASAIAQVSHPSVVNVFGIEVHDGQVGLCMELLRGRTLDVLLQTQGLFGAHEATLVAEAVCLALAAVHGAGVVHQDIKARNVMRTDGGRIVLMDFGTGRFLSAGDQAVTAGTPLYMAPEAFAGASASIAMDVYSTGVLLFHLVSGRYPYEGSSIDEVIRAHARGRRHLVSDYRPDLPPTFVRAIERALDPDPARRPHSAPQLMLELSEGGDKRRPEPPPPQPPPPQTVAPPPTPAPVSLATELWRYLSRDAARLALLVGGLAATLLVMGFVSSSLYAYVLGLDASYRPEGPLHWLRWGAKSLVVPAVLMIVVGVVLLSLSELLVVVRRSLPASQALSQRLARPPLAVLDRLGLGSASTLADLLVLGSLLFLAWVLFIGFADLRVAVTTPIDAAPAEVLARLSPANEAEHVIYRTVLSLAILLMVFGWIGVARLASRRGEPLRPVIVGGGAVTLALTLLLLNMPYQLLWWNEGEKAVYRGEDCYVIGEKPDVVRLFFPKRTSRGVVLRGTPPDLERSGVQENIFTGL